MIRKRDKAPFMIRTIFIMTVLYLTVMLAATWCVQARYFDEISGDKIWRDIATDLKLCKTTETDSAAYEDGFNKAEALAVLRYHRYQLNREFTKYGGAAEVQLYQSQTKDGKVTSLTPVTAPTPVLVGPPNYRNSRIMVPADSLEEGELARFTELAKAGAFHSYIDSIRGYQNGRFFYPSELGFYQGESEEMTTLTGHPAPKGKKVTFGALQDFAIYMPDGQVYGSYGLEEKESVKAYAAKVDAEFQKDELEFEVAEDSVEVRGAGLSQRASYFTTEHLFGPAYVLSVSIQVNPWLYALKQLRYLYPLAALLVIILTEILVTRHNLLIDEKLQGERRRRLMADSMAHEMKTPLSVIHNYGELLLNENDGTKRREYAHTIIEESENMNTAVVSMLDLSKMEAGTYPMDLSDFMLNAVVLEAADRFKGLLRERNIRIAVDVPEGVRLFADKELVETALTNFVSNAVIHGARDSLIKIEAREERSGQVKISVHNEGEPLTEDDMKRVWDAYYQGGQHGHNGGTGLGLAIVRNICIMHGGQYGCSNEAGGVTFWMKLASQEDRVIKMDLMTGPITGVTGDRTKVKGIGLVAFGTILQGLFWTFPFYTSMVGIIPSIREDAMFAMAVTPFDLILSLGAIAGTVSILVGLGRMKQGSRKRKRCVRLQTVALLLGCLIFASACVDIFHYSEPLETITHALEIALSLVIAAGLFANYDAFVAGLRKAGYDMRADKMRTVGIILLSAVVMFIILSATGIAMEMPWMLFTNVWLILSVCAGISWLAGIRGVMIEP